MIKVAEIVKALLEITASGNVQASHLIPFSSSLLVRGEETLTGAKVGKNGYKWQRKIY